MLAEVRQSITGAEDQPRKKDVCPLTPKSPNAVRLACPNHAEPVADSRAVKRQRRFGDVDTSDRHRQIPKKDFLEDWLSECSWSRERKRKRQNNMPRRPGPHPLPSPNETPTASFSTKSSKATASVHDPDDRQSLECRNIYIENQDPPSGLMDKARNIVLRARQTPELDDEAVAALKKTIRKIQNKGEEEVKNQMGPALIPGFNGLPNDKLERSSNQLWANAVPVPLNTGYLIAPPRLPLPKPKPDLAFGYSEGAFNPNQRPIFNLLVQDPLGSSFACPDRDLRFPFLAVEFKSQAKDGSHYTAFNQAAGAGAIAMNGALELLSRGKSADDVDFDSDEPQFFSVTIDQNVGCVNVHWIGSKAESGQHTFHLENLSMHILKDAEGIRAIRRAIKNIFDHASDKRLKVLADALDEYAKKMVAQKKSAESGPPPARSRGKAGSQRKSAKRVTKGKAGGTKMKNISDVCTRRRANEAEIT
ncbi:MAG: hypothetical protein LQ340_004958 [Diploschistes diacapsis]|nr:MAG: hypothetical protein LQ340_004958 [Diploschistes diacapsis]